MAAVRSGAKEEAAPGSILLVIHDFVARSADELSLAKGDRIELIERDDEFGDGWFLGRHMSNNKTGLFPEGMPHTFCDMGVALSRLQSTLPQRRKARFTMGHDGRAKDRRALLVARSRAMGQLLRHSKDTPPPPP